MVFLIYTYLYANPYKPICKSIHKYVHTITALFLGGRQRLFCSTCYDPDLSLSLHQFLHTYSSVSGTDLTFFENIPNLVTGRPHIYNSLCKVHCNIFLYIYEFEIIQIFRNLTYYLKNKDKIYGIKLLQYSLMEQKLSVAG